MTTKKEERARKCCFENHQMGRCGNEPDKRN
jgi:hypothetical protein